MFGSWNNARAITYRKLYDIPDDWGTAVNVQAMVFGNLGDDCATGVAFTRDPATGERDFYGEFLRNAQGEDVVAGIRTPQPLTRARRAIGRGARHRRDERARCPSLEELMPSCYAQLAQIAQQLEQHYRDMQDIEFTIERGQLWMLQTRNGKRTARRRGARSPSTWCSEGLIDRDDGASVRVDAERRSTSCCIPALDPKAREAR